MNSSRKKLIEVVLPLEAINAAAARAVIFAQMSAHRVHYVRPPLTVSRTLA
jgi:adenine-specific DNA methylase